MGLSYPKITLETIKPQTLGSLLIKLSQSNLNLRSSDSYFILSYLITTVFSVTRRAIPQHTEKTQVADQALTMMLSGSNFVF